MKLIHETLNLLSCGEAVSMKNLSVTPLLTSVGNEPDYLTLDEALARGEVRVTETSEAGEVPELRLDNRADQPVLLVDGEELVGAKQNRVLNLTILAPPKATITIPVSCVEAGRWAHSSPEFSTKGRAFYAAGRARKASHITESLRSSGTRRSRQGEVWNDIAEKCGRMQSHSATDAMACLFEDYGDQVDEYVQAIQPTVGQVGAVFAINGQVRGVELFDFAATLRKLYPKLVRSYALDAVDEQSHGSATSGPSPEQFVKAVASAEASTHPAVGEGTDVRLSGPHLSGGALEARGRLVHLCAFQLADGAMRGTGIRGGAMARASLRRGYHRSR